MDKQERGTAFIHTKGMIDEVDAIFSSEGISESDFDPVTGEFLESSAHKL